MALENLDRAIAGDPPVALVIQKLGSFHHRPLAHAFARKRAKAQQRLLGRVTKFLYPASDGDGVEHTSRTKWSQPAGTIAGRPLLFALAIMAAVVAVRTFGTVGSDVTWQMWIGQVTSDPTVPKVRTATTAAMIASANSSGLPAIVPSRLRPLRSRSMLERRKRDEKLGKRRPKSPLLRLRPLPRKEACARGR